MAKLIPTAVKNFFGYNNPAKAVIKEGETYFYPFSFTKNVKETQTPQGQINAYNACAPLNAVINRKARAFTNGRWYILDKQGKEAQGKSAETLRKLIKKPNPLQTWNQLMTQAKVYEQIFEEVFFLTITPVGFAKGEVLTLWVVPNWIINAKASGKLYQQSFIEDIVTHYELTYGGKTTKIDRERIIHIKGSNQNNEDQIRAKSRLVSLEDPISNIVAAYEARNVLITRKGAIGILSNVSRDVAGTIPVDSTEKKEVQEEFQNYGLSKTQSQVIITNANLRWQSMTFPTKDLMLFEEIEDDVRQICDTYNYPMYLLGFKAGTTYSNMGEANKSLYQDAIIPEAEGWAEAFTNYFELDKSGLEIKVFYDHLGIFQQSEKEKADALTAKVTANMPLLEKNIITLNQFLTAIDYDPRGPEGDKLLSDIQSMPLAVKLGAGGTQTMQAIMVDAVLTPNQKKQLLIILFGLSEQDANAITQA